MLDRAVKAIQNGENINLEEAQTDGVEFNLRIPALIPDDYLPDVHTRLTLYKRLSSGKDEASLHDLQVEMIDRFGLLPEQVKNLFRQNHMRFSAEKLGIAKIEASKHQGRIEFSKQTQVNPLTIVKLVQKQPQHYRLDGANHLKFTFDMESTESRLKTVNTLLETLQQAS